MFKQLFFDDQRLFVRENLDRSYGTPELVGTYRDAKVHTCYCWGWGIRGLDGKIHLLYQGYEAGYNHIITAAAISDDGIHFEPRNTASQAGIEKDRLPNQLLPCTLDGSEIATVIEDPFCAESERYKILFSDNSLTHTQCLVTDYIYTSPDLIHWKKKPNSCWNPRGTEPLTGAFYNNVSQKFTIMSRPDWGQRRVGITETSDWQTYTPLEMCLQVDSLDPALAEIYGMSAIAHENIFIGFPHIYTGFPQIRRTKFVGGTMHVELSYSLNGRHWQRSLRTPFLSGKHPQLIERDGVPAKMLYVNSVLMQEDGSLLLYTTTSRHEHGYPSEKVVFGDTSVSIFRLRKDGFIQLNTVDDKTIGRIAMREIAWFGDELHVNLTCKSATCAVYAEVGDDKAPIAGMSHEECVPFTGDSSDWKPQWTSGVQLSSLKEKVIIIEIKMTDGSIYSISGDGIQLMNIEASRYRRFKSLPPKLGF